MSDLVHLEEDREEEVRRVFKRKKKELLLSN